MSTLTLLPIVLGLAGVACFLVYLGTRQPRTAGSIEQRLADLSERQFTLEELELAQPFTERVIAPFFLRLARMASKFSPRSNLDKLRQQLLEAGSPSKLGVNEFLGLKLVLAGVCGGMIFLL